MMQKVQRSERGQALVLIVFGMIALIGMTGLAIDGGNAYSDRRHAQNAADTASLAAGLTLIRNSDPETGVPNAGAGDLAYQAGMARAAGNGYDNNQVTNAVDLYQCSNPAANCTLPAPEPFTDTNGNGVWDPGEPFTDVNGNGIYDANNPNDFVEAIIISHVSTYFAKVLGIASMTNNVVAIAKAVPPHPLPWYNGSALVATMPGCKPQGWPNDPFTVTGGSVSVITGSGGVFVDSNCQPDAFTSNSNSSISSVSGICVVGGAVVNGTVNPPVTHTCTQIDSQLYQLPGVSDPQSCPQAGTIFTVSPGNYVATPGYYTSTFPSTSPAGTMKLTKGIYCLRNGLSLSGTWNFTTDIDGNGTFDGSDGADEGVLLYVEHGGVTFNGSSFVRIGAINKVGTPASIKGYLLYVDPKDNSPVKLAGGNGSTFIGTILAPSSLVTIEGGSGSDSLNLQCQIIGNSINLTGGGTLNISYSQGQVGTTFTNPGLQPFR